MVALSIAFASYNLGLPLTLRSALYPLMGTAVWGRFGHGVDILAVFATLFGLATSLGLGAPQVAAGLAHLWGTPTTDTTHVLLIIGITGMALASVVSGMEKGIKRLSEVNVLLALLLLAFVLTVGPTRGIVTGAVTSLGQYLVAIGPLSNWVGREDLDFMHGWTTFFWAWWISWSPFVGLFIARVSRGRTVRELIACMLIRPTLVAALSMNAFGGTAVSQYVDGGYPDVIAAVQAQQPEIALFALLDTLPLAPVMSVFGLVLVVVFFVTSSDSGSLVIDTITAGGKLDTPVPQRVFWCIFEGLVAIALLLGGGLVAAQAATLAVGRLVDPRRPDQPAADRQPIAELRLQQHPHPHVHRQPGRCVRHDQAGADIHAGAGLGVAAVVPQPHLDARRQRHPALDAVAARGLGARVR